MSLEAGDELVECEDLDVLVGGQGDVGVTDGQVGVLCSLSGGALAGAKKVGELCVVRWGLGCGGRWRGVELVGLWGRIWWWRAWVGLVDGGEGGDVQRGWG